MDGTFTLDRTDAPAARLLALSPDLLGVTGSDGRLSLVNPAWSRILGWTADELTGRTYLDLVHAEDRAATAAILVRIGAGGAAGGYTCRLVRADGGERSVRWRAEPAPGGGVYLAGRDVTEQRRLEEELAASSDRLERKAAELQDFAYVASHDLAEPLRMITSYLDLLQRRYGGRLDDTADEFIGYAVGGALRLRSLIDALLIYSRTGSQEMEPVEVDLGVFVPRVLRSVDVVREEAGGRVSLLEPLPAVRADPAQLAQLLQNLLLNALTFGSPGAGPQVTVAAAPHDGGVRIDVGDDGIGIAAQHHDRIFKPFARLHGREEYPGTGMGLAVCRRIAERHGGRIWVEAEPGSGSTFHVWLPG